MGGKSIDGKFVSGEPCRKLVEKSFYAQVRSNYDWYSGNISTIRDFKEVEIVRKRNGKIEIEPALKRFMERHPEYKTKEDILINYLHSEYGNSRRGEAIYTVDYSTPCGYEIVTYGGMKEVDIKILPEIYMDYLETDKKGYKIFHMTHRTSDKRENEPERNSAKSDKYFTEYNFDTLQDAEDEIRKEVVRYRKTYFILKNDATKAYMISPNVIAVHKTVKKDSSFNDSSIRVDEAFPVYFIGMAWE